MAWVEAMRFSQTLKCTDGRPDDAKWRDSLFRILALQSALNLFVDEEGAVDILEVGGVGDFWC